MQEVSSAKVTLLKLLNNGDAIYSEITTISSYDKEWIAFTEPFLVLFPPLSQVWSRLDFFTPESSPSSQHFSCLPFSSSFCYTKALGYVRTIHE